MYKEYIIKNIVYVDPSDKYYARSYAEGKVFKAKSIKEIHKNIYEILYEEDYMRKVKSRKPQKIYRDTENGPIHVGYFYRLKTEIDGKRVYFDAWIEVYRLETIEDNETQE